MALTHDQRLMADMLVKYSEDYQLGWAVGKFSGSDRWLAKYYDAEVNEFGQLTITDRLAGAELMIYGAAGVDWHTLRLEYSKDNISWYLFRPTEMLAEFGESCGDPVVGDL